MKLKSKILLNILALLFLLFTTTIDTAPAGSTLNKRQDEGEFNSNILKPFLPLAKTDAPETRTFNLTLARANLAPDGFTRSVWTSNNQYPGPMIRVNKGDRIIVNLVNNLNDYCTIHWHGIFQKGTTYYDGVAGQTQCLIPNGATFVYNFTTGDQYGTYWWHSHYLSQYVDGLRGPLIIHDPEDPFLKDYDEEIVITLSDWYHDESRKLLDKRMAPGYQGFNPIPNAGLISGRGRFDCSKAPKDSTCKPDNPYAVYLIQKGKRYRIRIINTSAEVTFTFSIDEHPLTLIEVEGENIKPIVLNKFNIAVGQRYSGILTADKDVKNFWIRATIIKECVMSSPETINFNDNFLDYTVTGILRYDGAPDGDPQTTEFTDEINSCRDVDHNLLKLYNPRPPPDPVTDNFVFHITFGPNEQNTTHAYIDGATFVPDLDDPTTNKIMAGGKETPKQLDRDQIAFVYDTENGAVEISLINENGATHPFHLHGHNFYIMGHGKGKVPDPSTFNMKDPAVRDTVTVDENSWTVIRFPINNPGVWAFHCHIEWHVEMGMVGQLIERPSVLKSEQIPSQLRSICPSGEAEKRELRKLAKYYRRNPNSKVGIIMRRGSAY